MATMVRESAIMPGWATMRELAKIAQTSDGAMRIWIMRHPECERRLVGNVNVFKADYILQNYRKR